jgi:hypothetical protein
MLAFSAFSRNKNNIFFYFEKTLFMAHYNASAEVVNTTVVGLAPGLGPLIPYDPDF